MAAFPLISRKDLTLLLGRALLDFYGASFLRIRAYLPGHPLADGLVLGFMYLLPKDSSCWRPSRETHKHDGGLEAGKILLGEPFGW